MLYFKQIMYHGCRDASALNHFSWPRPAKDWLIDFSTSIAFNLTLKITYHQLAA